MAMKSPVQGKKRGSGVVRASRGVPCGQSWISRTKKCSKGKAATTPAEAKQRGVAKAKALHKLKGEVKAAKGQKARNITPYEKRERRGQMTLGLQPTGKSQKTKSRTAKRENTYTKTEAAQKFKSVIEKEFPAIRVSVWEKGGKTRAYVKDTTQRRSGAQDRGYISFDATGVDNSKYRGFLGGGEVVKKFMSGTIIS